MAGALAAHISAILDKRMWLDNPLAVRDARREFRHDRVLKSIAVQVVMLIVCGFIACWILLSFVRFERHIPDAMGGDGGTALVIIVSGIHFWLVTRAAQRRVEGMLMREASLDGMTSLLMLPLSRISLVLQGAAYPWLAATTTALLLLPVYVLLVGLDGMTWAELFSLYTLFALAAIAIPGFRRPALGGGVGPAILNQAVDNPNSEPDAGRMSKVGVKQSLSALITIGAIPAVLVVISIITGTAGIGPDSAVARYVPESVLSLVSTIIISLPLLLARAMITPFGFFQWTLIPLPLVVCLVIVRKYLNLLRTSEFLSIGQYRDLATLPSYLPRRAAENCFRIVVTVAAAGFLWPWAVRDNGLGLLASNPMYANSGVQGFVFLASAAAAAFAIFRAGLLGSWSPAVAARGGSPRTTTWVSALRYCAAPFFVSAAIAVLCLMLGEQLAPAAREFGTVWRIFAISCASMLLNYGLRRLAGSYGYLGLAITAIAVFGPASAFRLVVLSPALGIIRVGPRNLYGLSNPGAPLFGSPEYLRWVEVLAGIGIALCAAAWVLHAMLSKRQSREMEADGCAANPRMDPTVLGLEVFADTEQGRRESVSRSDSPLSLAVIRGIGRVIDNAVLIRDLRARLRNRLSAPKLAIVFAAALVLTIVIIHWLPMLASPGSGFGGMLYENVPAQSPLFVLGNLQGCCYIGELVTAFLCGYGVLPRAFGMDKRKNTLTFLLTTPMSTVSIVLGKAFALILTCGAAFWFCAVASLIFCLPIAAISGSLVCVSWWAAITGSAFVEYAAVAMIMMALGTLFPNITAFRLNGCIRLVILWVVYVAVSVLNLIIGLIANWYHISAQAMWIGTILCGIAIVVICLLMCVGSVGGMRKGDIDIKLSRQ